MPDFHFVEMDFVDVYVLDLFIFLNIIVQETHLSWAKFMYIVFSIPSCII